MKPQVITWGWKEYARTFDPQMTRARLARLMRCWRRARTQGRREFNLQRIGAHVYRVESVRFNDVETFEIRGRHA